MNKLVRQIYIHTSLLKSGYKLDEENIKEVKIF